MRIVVWLTVCVADSGGGVKRNSGHSGQSANRSAPTGRPRGGAPGDVFWAVLAFLRELGEAFGGREDRSPLFDSSTRPFSSVEEEKVVAACVQRAGR